jgi:hypothetical protein
MLQKNSKNTPELLAFGYTDAHIKQLAAILQAVPKL